MHSPGVAGGKLFESALRYWRQLCPQGALPAYNQFDPVAVPWLLPHLVVKDVLYDPLDFRYRLMGEAVRVHVPRCYLGLRMSELAHQSPGTDLFEALGDLVISGQPSTHTPPYLGPNKLIRAVETLLLPFSNGGDRVEIVIEAIHFRHRADG